MQFGAHELQLLQSNLKVFLHSENFITLLITSEGRRGIKRSLDKATQGHATIDTESNCLSVHMLAWATHASPVSSLTLYPTPYFVE